MSEGLDSLTASDFAKFRDLVHDASGMDLPEIRIADMARVVGQARVQANLMSNDELIAYWSNPSKGRESLKQAILGLTVGETYFFRDSAQFDALRQTVIPELIETRRLSRTLRVWSAGCSTGEEPYSLAMMIDSFSQATLGWDISILGTDVNTNSLETARKGLYGAWSFRQAPLGIKEQYFTQVGMQFQINESIRAKVQFAELNFGEEFPATLPLNDLDLILCRNVLIYLSREAIRRVAHRFHRVLAPHGWLVVAPSELSQVSFDMFEPVNFPAAVLYRKPKQAERKFEFPQSSYHAQTFSPPYEQPPTQPPMPTVVDQPTRVSITKQFDLGSLDAVRALLVAKPYEASSLIEEAARAGISPVYYWAAQVSLDRSDLAAAEAWVEKALKSEPLSARSHYLHGVILKERGKTDAAATALRKCIFADPTFVLGHVSLADLLESVGEVRRARSARQTALDLMASKPDDKIIVEGDGMTVGRLRTLLRGRN